MQNKIEEYIDSLLSEGSGYIPENIRKLIFKVAVKAKVFKKKEEFDSFIDKRIDLFNEKENCPNCSAEKSKLLQVCDSCGYVMPGAHASVISVQTLIENIENSIVAINSVPKPTLFFLFKEQYHIIFPYLTLWSVILVTVARINYNVSSLYVFVIFFAFLSLVSFIFKRTKDKIDRIELLKSFSGNFEKTKTLANRHFGQETTVQNLLNSYEGKINQIKNSKKTIRNRLLIIYGIIFIRSLFLIEMIRVQIGLMKCIRRK
jgi:hypothetical protein